MPNMTNKFFAGLFLFLSAGLFAQGGSSSPYSFYGIGEIVAGGTADARAMGGIGVVSDSIHINLLNPAGYSVLRRTSLGVGAMHSRLLLTTNTDKDRATSTNLNYLAVAVPYKKWGFGFGVMPYSSVGYRIASRTVSAIDSDEFDVRQYSGTGGVNRVFFAASYALNSHLNVGLQYDFNFGQIENISLESQYGVQLAKRENVNSDLQGNSLTAGVHFKKQFAKKYDFYLSGVYALETKLRHTAERSVSTVSISTGGGQTVVDTEELESGALETVRLPSRLTFGAGFGRARKWLLAAEASLTSAGSGGRFDITDVSGDPIVTYNKVARYSLGGYFIPRYDAYKGYFKRIVYRAGLRYEDTGLEIEGHKIEDMAFTFGFGLPMRGTFTNLNLGFELGHRGTKAGNLIHENYTKVTLAFSFSDLWFIKPKYD